MIEDRDRIGVSGHRAGAGRTTCVFDPAILDAGVHRLAVHDGIGREAWATHGRNDDDAFAAGQKSSKLLR